MQVGSSNKDSDLYFCWDVGPDTFPPGKCQDNNLDQAITVSIQYLLIITTVDTTQFELLGSLLKEP